MCDCVRNPGGHAESDPEPSEEGVSCYHILRPLDRRMLAIVNIMNFWMARVDDKGNEIASSRQVVCASHEDAPTHLVGVHRERLS